MAIFCGERSVFSHHPDYRGDPLNCGDWPEIGRETLHMLVLLERRLIGARDVIEHGCFSANTRLLIKVREGEEETKLMSSYKSVMITTTPITA
jgi:hypothetical protein